MPQPRRPAPAPASPVLRYSNIALDQMQGMVVQGRAQAARNEHMFSGLPPDLDLAALPVRQETAAHNHPRTQRPHRPLLEPRQLYDTVRQVSPARSILSNALNFCRSAIAAFVRSS